MQSAFTIHLQLGFEHITDLNGYDHILFLVALCGIYQIKDWKKVAILVTAFTIGHSLTLGLAAMEWIPFSTKVVEFLIPITIFLTAIYNILKKEERAVHIKYIFALLFGLVHGMGFSNFFRSSLFPGQEDVFLSQLLAFNIGVELGQLLIVAILLAIVFIALNEFRLKQRYWNISISVIVAIFSLQLMIETYPF